MKTEVVKSFFKGVDYVKLIEKRMCRFFYTQFFGQHKSKLLCFNPISRQEKSAK